MTNATAPVVQITPLALDRDGVCAALNIGKTLLQTEVTAGRLPKPRRIGGRALWPVAELQAALLKLPVSDLLPPPAGKGA